jgi:hypothetical protein
MSETDVEADAERDGGGSADEVDIDIPSVRFGFAEDVTIKPFSWLFGVRPERAYVELSGLTLRARFGPWVVETPIANVASAEVTGPYQWIKVVGPARGSLRDRGLTFATTTRGGVLITFVEPVTGLDALGLNRHPNLTVTVDRPDELVAALEATEDDAELIERDEHDQLQAMTAHELRALARRYEIPHASGLKKAELIEALQAVID